MSSLYYIVFVVTENKLNEKRRKKADSTHSVTHTQRVTCFWRIFSEVHLGAHTAEAAEQSRQEGDSLA